MHQLFVEVLSKKDLSRAGELFAIPDRAIVGDLSELLATIQRISSATAFAERHNEQSVVEICLTRIISAIRDTNTIEENAVALVSLLNSCLLHDLKPTSKDQDPPHAKIASEVVSCIFLNHSKKSVMCLAVPVAVKLLHRGNRELSRNLSSYLSLAAINNGDILAAHIQPIIDSIIGGNYSLVRVLPKIYAFNREAIHEHLMGLVCLLSTSASTDSGEKVSLLNLLALVSKVKPASLEYSLPQLADCLSSPQTAYTVLVIFLDMAAANAAPFADYTGRVMSAAAAEPIHSGMISLAAELLGMVGRLGGSLGEGKAPEIVKYLVHQLATKSLDLGTAIALLRQTKTVAEVHPAVLAPPTMGTLVAAMEQYSSSATVQTYLQQLNALNAASPSSNTSSSTLAGLRNSASELTSAKYACSKSGSYFENKDNSNYINTTNTFSNSKSSGGKLLTSNGFHILHRSSPRLHVLSGHHITGGNSGGSNSHHGNSLNVHRSLNALVASSSAGPSNSNSHYQQNHNHHNNHQANNHRLAANRMSVESMSMTPSNYINSSTGHQKSASSSYLLALQEKELQQAAAAASGNSGGNSRSPGSKGGNTYGHYITGSSVDSQLQTQTALNSKLLTSSSSSSSHYNLRNSEKEIMGAAGGLFSNGTTTYSSRHNISSNNNGNKVTSGGTTEKTSTLSSAESTVSFPPPTLAATGSVDLQNNNNLNNANSSSGSSSQLTDAMTRMSVFEPYPMRDAVQHFCEKHIDKIKAYMTKVFVKIPQPVKITIEEKKSKKMVAKIYFNCQTKGQHCLYNSGASNHYFSFRTRSAPVWIHLMFLALQARAPAALCTREPSVHSLKNCWETLKLDSRTFLTLVTSSFPSAKDQEVLIEELRSSRYFDVFKFNALVGLWGCFLCNHPDKATGFLRTTTPRVKAVCGGSGNDTEAVDNNDNGQLSSSLGSPLPQLQPPLPVIEGTLKEKKGGRWKLFRRWRTRYFTLSGVHLYRDEVSSTASGHVLASASTASASASTKNATSASASKASRLAAAFTGGGSLHRLLSSSSGFIAASSSSSFLQQGEGGHRGTPTSLELLGKVQSVRALGNNRGRTIPKAFEIFTSEKTYVLKAPNNQNNQEWMQCLSIAMAHNNSNGGGQEVSAAKVK